MTNLTYQYHVTVNGEYADTFDNLEAAIRRWDSLTYLAPPTSGGIHREAFDLDGVMLIDGHILHVRDGIIYLNPNLKEL